MKGEIKRERLGLNTETFDEKSLSKKNVFEDTCLKTPF